MMSKHEMPQSWGKMGFVPVVNNVKRWERVLSTFFSRKECCLGEERLRIFEITLYASNCLFHARTMDMLQSDLSSTGFRSITGQEPEVGFEAGGIGSPCRRGNLC